MSRAGCIGGSQIGCKEHTRQIFIYCCGWNGSNNDNSSKDEAIHEEY